MVTDKAVTTMIHYSDISLIMYCTYLYVVHLYSFAYFMIPYILLGFLECAQ